MRFFRPIHGAWQLTDFPVQFFSSQPAPVGLGHPPQLDFFWLDLESDGPVVSLPSRSFLQHLISFCRGKQPVLGHASLRCCLPFGYPIRFQPAGTWVSSGLDWPKSPPPPPC
jgi:hypothetical protein